MRCKFSKSKLRPFMSFGKMPMANGFLSKKDFHKEFFYDLEVGFNQKNYLFQDYPLQLQLHFLLIDRNQIEMIFYLKFLFEYLIPLV